VRIMESFNEFLGGNFEVRMRNEKKNFFEVI
jgi:hypothetical protein